MRSWGLVAAAVAVLVGGCADSSTGPGSCGAGLSIGVGDSRNGSLQSGDELDFDGAYLDSYNLRVESRRSVTITLRASSFDAFLWLLDDDENVLESDDDSGGDFDARIVSTLDAGCYVIQATSYDVGEVGSYTLSVN